MSMFAALSVVSVLLGLHAIFGNLFVYVRLVQRDVPVNFLLIGMPGYLASVCSSHVTVVGPTLVWVARSTVYAFIAGMVLVVGLLARN